MTQTTAAHLDCGRVCEGFLGQFRFRTKSKTIFMTAKSVFISQYFFPNIVSDLFDFSILSVGSSEVPSHFLDEILSCASC